MRRKSKKRGSGRRSLIVAVVWGIPGTRTLKLLMMYYNNRAEGVPGIPQTTATINDRRPDPRFFDFRRISNSSRAYFDAGRVTYTLPSWQRLTLETSYWFSKAIDTGASYVNIAAGDDALQGYAQAATGIAADLKGVSNFDQSHALLMRFTYAVPVWSSVRRMTKDWRLSAVYLAKTGMPFTVIGGSDDGAEAYLALGLLAAAMLRRRVARATA